MIKSMTAYSRAAASSSLGRLIVEIHSVNGKRLDLSVHLPKNLLSLDLDLRKWLSASLDRGQVTLRLTIQADGASPRALTGYYEQLKLLKKGWEKIAADLGYDSAQTIDLPFLVSQLHMGQGAETDEEEKGLKQALKEAVDEALADLMRMKETEGKTLAHDMQKRLKILEEGASAIEAKKELPLVHYQKKLIERFKEVGQVHQEAEERIAREIALLTEKMDVTEELVRLRAHCEQFRHHLSSAEKAVGRTLDFLTQEMNREINTLGSKSADSEISLYIVKMKGELDKIREQVQNIE
jgi:uncharacterized protein (TIGR00255 family)